MNMAGISHAGASWMERSFGNNVRVCSVCPRAVSLRADPDALPGEERAARHPSKSSKPDFTRNSVIDRSHGTWPLKSLVRLILHLDTIFYTTRLWLSRETVVAHHRSGITYLKIAHS